MIPLSPEVNEDALSAVVVEDARNGRMEDGSAYSVGYINRHGTD
jgi:hypothetical protein